MIENVYLPLLCINQSFNQSKNQQKRHSHHITSGKVNCTFPQEHAIIRALTTTTHYQITHTCDQNVPQTEAYLLEFKLVRYLNMKKKIQVPENGHPLSYLL